MRTLSINQLLSLGFSVLCFTLFFNGSKKQSSDIFWVACHSHSTKKVHFMNIDRFAASKPCSGSISLKGPKGYSLIRNSSTSTFGTQIPGTKRVINLKDGRRISATQWKRKGHHNKIVISEPNFASGKLKTHCVIKNAGNAFATRFNHKINTFQVQVLSKNSKKSKTVRKAWVNCRL